MTSKLLPLIVPRDKPLVSPIKRFVEERWYGRLTFPRQMIVKEKLEISQREG